MTTRFSVFAFVSFLTTGALASEAQPINAVPTIDQSVGVLLAGTRLSISYVPVSTKLELSAGIIRYDGAKQETTLDSAARVAFDSREIKAGKIVVTRVQVGEKDYLRITAIEEARP